MSDSPQGAARIICDHRLSRRRLAQLEGSVRPPDEAGGYAVQDQLHSMLTVAGLGPVAGHKIGCTTKVMQEFLRISNPCAGGVFASQVHKTPADCVKDALVKMDAAMASYTFTDGRIKAAAAKMVEGYRARQANTRSLGHTVGLEVHDVGGLQADTFEPGRVFTIEPQFRIEEEHLGIRLEDMILITDNGVEVLSGSLPITVAEIEQAMKR
jgi:hypothetical protein